MVVGRIAQDVPLPDGSNIRAGSKVEGRIVEVTPVGSASGPRISIQVEKVYSQGKAIPVTTNLRAMAGFMEVMQTGVPEEGASEGTPSNWWTTTQVGGDSVYGVGGPVMSAQDSSEVVGWSVNGGVLSLVSAKEGIKCRGPVAGKPPSEVRDEPRASRFSDSLRCTALHGETAFADSRRISTDWRDCYPRGRTGSCGREDRRRAAWHGCHFANT